MHTFVQDELEWAPEVDTAGVGVSVEEGVVTLSGEVDTYWEKVAAANAALHVRGVRTVVNGLVVHPASAWGVSDTDIAKAVDQAIASASNIPKSVKAELRDRQVRLTGQVGWDYERRAAERAVQHVRGVRHVVNLLTLEPAPAPADVEQRIRQALERDAQLGTAGIQVAMTADTVTLSGTVRSWAERNRAENIAWRAPFVRIVDNLIAVRDDVPGLRRHPS